MSYLIALLAALPLLVMVALPLLFRIPSVGSLRGTWAAAIALAASIFAGFPILLLLAVYPLVGASPNYAPPPWLRSLSESAACLLLPLLPILVAAGLFALRRLSFHRQAQGSRALFIASLVVATLANTAAYGLSRISIVHFLTSSASPNGTYHASLYVSTWMDASYSLHVTRGPIPLRARVISESIGTYVRFDRNASVHWSADSRFVSAWANGIPLSAFDTVTQEEIYLRHDLLVIAPTDPTQRRELYARLIAANMNPAEWLTSRVVPGQESVRQEILDLVPDVNAPVMGGCPLHAALYANDAALVEALLRRGADPDRRIPNSRYGETPLMIAATRGDPGLVRLLLRYGTDPARTDYAGRTATDMARGPDKTTIIELLAAGTQPRPQIENQKPKTKNP